VPQLQEQACYCAFEFVANDYVWMPRYGRTVKFESHIYPLLPTGSLRQQGAKTNTGNLFEVFRALPENDNFMSGAGK
jgi:hypothetical protein